MPILHDEDFHRIAVASRFRSIVRRRLDIAGLDDVQVHCDEASGFYGDSIEFRFSHVAREVPVLLSIERTGGLVVAPPVLEAFPVAGKYRTVSELDALIAEAVGCVSGYVKDMTLTLH